MYLQQKFATRDTYSIQTFFFVNYILGGHENFIDRGNKFRQLLFLSIFYIISVPNMTNKVILYSNSEINQINERIRAI